MCDACHVREATHHSVIFDHGMMKSSELCAECFAGSAPTLAIEMVAAVSQAPCRFCGAPATSGGPDMKQLASGIHEMLPMCGPCSDEYFRYLSEEMRSLTKNQQQRPNAIESVMQGIASHMQHWVAEQSGQNDK